MSMHIYTRTGDQGLTSLIGGRVSKDDAQVEAYGTIDELNAFVGVAIATLPANGFDDLRAQLLQIQHELFDCGADLAYADPDRPVWKTQSAFIDQLELWIDQLDQETTAIERFILPGGSLASANLHVCRTVCRRAERRVITLSQRQQIHMEVVRYLNRLSDYLFQAARTTNMRQGEADVDYVRSAHVFR